MSFFEKGKALAREGQYKEALQLLSQALEQDKNNADIHFFIGLCYSSLQEFSYAKYHYQLAITINPNHERTKLLWNEIVHFEAKKPPAIELSKEISTPINPKSTDQTETSALEEHANTQSRSSDLKSQNKPSSDEKWERAFPTEIMKVDNQIPVKQKISIFIVLLFLAGAIGYFIFQSFIGKE